MVKVTPSSAVVAPENEQSEEVHGEGLREQPKTPSDDQTGSPLGLFGKWLSVIVIVSMVIGALIGYFAPVVAEVLGKATFFEVNLPIAVLIWIMIFPMLLSIDWTALQAVARNPRALGITTLVNYAIQPFLMFGLAVLFFRVIFAPILSSDTVGKELVAGSVILGAAPCTAMVFVWSALVKGDASYTIVQVALNDLVMLVAYVPTVGLLIGASDLSIPWATLAISVALFVVIPGGAAILVRNLFLRSEESVKVVEDRLKPFSMVALVLTIVLIFVFQGAVIVDRLLLIVLIAVPLTIQTYLIFFIAYALMYFFQVQHKYAAPGAMIASSNFFELAVAVAINAYGPASPATLATVVGVLTEVPIMLSLCWICNHTIEWFDFKKPEIQQEV